MKVEELPRGKVNEQLLVPQAKLTEDNLKSLLRSMNLKVTAQRLFILKALSKGPKTHVTAKELFERVRTRYTNLGFATVYRFLKVTAQFGVTSELRIARAPARYELKTKQHHHHIICTRCGKIIEFQSDLIEEQIVKISKEKNFLMEHHIFELYGRCSRSGCRT